MENVIMHNSNIEETHEQRFTSVKYETISGGSIYLRVVSIKKKPVYVIFLHYVINNGNYLN